MQSQRVPVKHRAYYGRTYGSASQQVRRQREKQYTFLMALRSLSVHHTTHSLEALEEMALALLDRSLKADPEGTLKALEIEDRFTVEELITSTIIILHLEVMCRQGKAHRMQWNIYEIPQKEEEVHQKAGASRSW